MAWLPTDHPLKLIADEDNFYDQTKSPVLNSKLVDTALDEYMSQNGLTFSQSFCLDDTRGLIAHPLVNYGNHTYNHYVLSALSRQEQVEEIGRNHKVLRAAGVPVSKALSVPFGGPEHFNSGISKLLKS